MDIKFDIKRRGTVFSMFKSTKGVEKAIDHKIGIYTQIMANMTYSYAPVLEHVLAPSILNSPKKLGDMHYIYGSTVPYSRRWEYEHRTKSGYFRKSVEKNAPKLAEEIANAVKGSVEGSAKKV